VLPFVFSQLAVQDKDSNASKKRNNAADALGKHDPKKVYILPSLLAD
jgi:hypothetical protein